MTDPLLYVMTAFVVVAGLSLLLQTFLLLGIYKSAKATQQRVDALAPKAESLLLSAQTTLEQSKAQVLDATAKANQILDTTRTQLTRIDEVLADATSRAKVQMERVELVVDDTLSRVHETVGLLHSGILRPLREVNGLVAGVRATVGHLLSGGRPTVAQATHDDEMFI